MAGEAGADDGDAGESEAGGGKGGGKGTNHEGGSAGIKAQAGEAGSTEEAGTGGMAGDSSVELELAIAEPNLAAGKTYVPFNAMLEASGAAHYAWSITSGVLPAGLDLQGIQAATLAIVGTPSEAGQFPLSLSVTDGAATKTVDVTLVVTHSAIFLSDRVKAGVNELFLADIGAQSAATPVRLSASIPSGGNITSYAWSPDGSKVLYLATQSSGGPAELWIASLANPGTALRVSAAGVAVSQVAWLKSGSIAAYATSSGDAYLVDLSGSSPGESKLAVTGSSITTGAAVGTLQPSPNGTSIIFPYYVPMTLGTPYYAYLTWTGNSPKAVIWNGGISGFETYSYDGRFGALNSSGGAQWVDLSLPAPTPNALLSYRPGAWSPNAELLLYFADFVSGDPMELRLGAFSGGTFTFTSLAASAACGSTSVAPWSPNGKNALLNCGKDLRAISNVAAATPNDFSLLPSGFLSNTFTGIGSTNWSPDSAWVAMSVDRDVDKQNDLYLVRWVAPGAAYKAHSNSSAEGVTTYAFAPSSQAIAFVGTITPQANAGLYLTKLPANGAPPLATIASAPASAIVQNDVNWLPGSRVLAYRANVAGATQLFAVPLSPDGTPGTPISISGVSGSGVSSYQLAPTR